MNLNEYLLKEEYLKKYIFVGLDDVNDGFDSSTIRYFSSEQFAIVMKRCANSGVGILGIERWKIDKTFDSVVTYEDYKTFPQDSNWYLTAFRKLNTHRGKFIYSASYRIAESAFQKKKLKIFLFIFALNFLNQIFQKFFERGRTLNIKGGGV